MKILGFNFTKIAAQKQSKPAEKLSLSTNIDIQEIEDVKSEMIKSKEEIISIKFEYNIDYNPNFAKISLIGVILLSLESKLKKDVLKEWKDKKLPNEFKVTLFNIILRKSNVKCLNLEDELNLPLHIPLPSIKVEEK